MEIVYDTQRRKVGDKFIENSEKKVFEADITYYELQIKLFPMLRYKECLNGECCVLDSCRLTLFKEKKICKTLKMAQSCSCRQELHIHI